MIFFAISVLAHRGSYRQKVLFPTDVFKPWDSEKEELVAQGYIQVDATYQHLFKWSFLGVLDIIISTFKVILQAVKFPFKFMWLTIRLIHSHKRILCGVDSAVGVAAAYLVFQSSVNTFPEHLAVSVFGGLIGAGCGMLNWEIVSKRILKLVGQE